MCVCVFENEKAAPLAFFLFSFYKFSIFAITFIREIDFRIEEIKRKSVLAVNERALI